MWFGRGRNIGQPLAVRRESGKTLVEFGVQIREGLAVAKERQQPDVGSSLGILYSLDDITSIARPIHWVLDPCVFIQNLVLGDATRCPLVHVKAPVAKLHKSDASAVRRPDWVQVLRGAEGE